MAKDKYHWYTVYTQQKPARRMAWAKFRMYHEAKQFADALRARAPKWEVTLNWR